MIIGITCNLDTNIFQTAISVYKLLSITYKDSIEIILINTDITKNVPKYYNNSINIQHISQITSVDILIDIERLLHKDIRNKIAKTKIVFLRTNIQFTELDKSVYIQDIVHNTFEEINEVWVWDILNTEESIECLKPLIKCPIRLIPYTWESNTNIPINLEIPRAKWNICINEKNTENMSSCIIPLVALREIENTKPIDALYTIYIKEDIFTNKFLKENILNNIYFDDLNARIEHTSFNLEDCSSSTIYLSHSRFTPLDTSLLQILWHGIPIVHNSPILRDLHPVLHNLYYNSNQISEICRALKYFSENYMEWYENRENIRKKIEEKWSATPEKGMGLLKMEIQSTTPKNRDSVKKEFVIGFYGMWEGFNVQNNFFTDALQNIVKDSIKIKGIQYIDSIKPNIILYGPFANHYQFPEDIPTIFFSGENIPYPENIPTSLYLGPKEESENRIRLPLWMLYIDWFTNSKELPKDSADNPIRIPVHFAINPHHIPCEKREEFCAFVVSNPSNQLRNDTFHVVNAYKKVNSGGILFNNIGYPLEMKYPGGGGGDISKFNFFEKHKFTLSFENSQSPGYITEKVLHAKMAGCIPIYWGDTNTDNDFTPGSIYNVSNEISPHEIRNRIMELESNINLCNKISSTPILDTEKYTKALNLISRVSNKLLELGGFTSPTPSTPTINITKTIIINLDRRKDRYEKLLEAHPFLHTAERVSAVDGKTLSLSKEIVELFRANDFKWKKSVMGCALSHINIWKKLASEPENTRYLILEDDVRFYESVSEINKKLEGLPTDAELVYLGGVLPLNLPHLKSALYNVTDTWAKLKKNTLFTKEPTELFHFCTYSYILTKSGAQKLLSQINKTGCFTSIDHFLNHPQIPLIKYIAYPLLTSCFQENDPLYINSDFNNFNRLDTFDSDIWNNNEHFMEQDIISTFQKKKTIYYLKEYSTNSNFNLYERKWIDFLFGKIELKELNISKKPEPDAWYLVMRPFSEFFKTYLLTLETTFNILHTSDEFLKDNIDFYFYKNCKNVIRNYYRDDTKHLKNIITIPLGYHYKSDKSENSQNNFESRKLVWSFHGTDWFDRKLQLEKIQDIFPYNCHLTPNWNHESMSSEEKYLTTLSNSKFCPILRGNNIETYRLYEVLEAGTIPIYVRTEGDTIFWNELISNIPMVNLDNWEKARVFMRYLLNNPEKGEIYRRGLLEKWNNWKASLCQEIQQIL